jgi:hypothetical protein
MYLQFEYGVSSTFTARTEQKRTHLNQNLDFDFRHQNPDFDFRPVKETKKNWSGVSGRRCLPTCPLLQAHGLAGADQTSPSR